MLSSIIIAQNSTSYGQISSKPKPRLRIVKAKAKGQGSSRPRPQNFASSRSRPVLEDSIPGFYLLSSCHQSPSLIYPFHLGPENNFPSQIVWYVYDNTHSLHRILDSNVREQSFLKHFLQVQIQTLWHLPPPQFIEGNSHTGWCC